MYTGFKPSTPASKTMVAGINESQLQTLQREVDTYTRKLEQEKKKYFGIQDTYKIILEEYEKEKGKLNEHKKQSNKNNIVIVQNKIKNLQANLEKAISIYDETVTYNQKLKNQIDMLRRQKKNHTDSQNLIQSQIKHYQQQIQKKQNDILQKKNTTQLLKNNIMEIKQKNELEKQQYHKQFDEMEKDYLKQKKQRQYCKMEKNKKPQPIDTQYLLKYRLKKLIKSNKNKIKMIDHYKKHMKQIQQAFNQIKKNSGIEHLNQITNIFLKSQQQNYSLYNYMDSLSRNIDKLEKSNAELQKNIARQQQSEQCEKAVESPSDETKKEKELEQYLLKKEQATQQLNQLVLAIKPQLTSALLELVDSTLNDDPSKLVQYQLGININERTIEGYLSDLEKFVNTLLMLRQQTKPKNANPVKDSITVYSKPIPNITTDDLSAKQKNGDSKDDQKLMDQGKFREYALQYWEKKKNKLGNSTKE